MQRVFGIIVFCGLVSFAILASIVMRYDVERREVDRQVALLKAQTVLSDAQNKQQIALIVAQERLEKVKLRSDPAVKSSLVQALKVRAVLSAWLPIYLPVFLFAGLSSVVGIYYSFRLVTFRHEGIETPVRAFDAPRLVSQSLQVKALEASQGVDVLKLAEAISTRQLQSFSHLARGFRGLMGREITGKQAALPPVMEQPANVPTFSELFAHGKIAEGRPLIMGFANGQPQERTVTDLKAISVAGEQGSGKTLSMAYIITALIALYDKSEAFVIDPHKDHEEGLGSVIKALEQTGRVHILNTFDTEQTIDELNARLDRRLSGVEPSDAPVVFVVDELAKMGKTPLFAEKLLPLVERFTEETRKANFVGVFGSQKWSARHFGNKADIRACMNSLLVHRTKPSQADLLLEDSQNKKLVKQVTRPGMALLATSHDSDPTVVQMPLIRREDIEHVARTLKQVELSEPTQATESELDSLTDAQLIGRVNLKKGMMGNNEFARFIGQDEGLTSKSLRGLSMPLFPAMRTAFKKFLQGV